MAISLERQIELQKELQAGKPGGFIKILNKEERDYVRDRSYKMSLEHKSILIEAEDLVHGDRNAAYGHPLDDYTRTAKMWSAILGIEVTAHQAILCMCTMKISRECNKSKRDNMVDLAGYAECAAWVKDETYKRELEQETFSPLEDL